LVAMRLHDPGHELFAGIVGHTVAHHAFFIAEVSVDEERIFPIECAAAHAGDAAFLFAGTLLERLHHLDVLPGYSQRSSTTLMPCPTPMHMVANAYCCCVRCSWRRAVSASRTPDAPRGCPSAMAPP